MTKSEKAASVRATVSIPVSQYDVLERMAQEKKVSLSWVVRDAVENYVAQRWPLLGDPLQSENLKKKE